MTHNARRRHLNARLRCARDDGAILLLAIVFLALFGVAVTALLGYAETNLRAHRAIESQGEDLYAADAAVEAAIETIRGDLSAGRDPAGGGTCPGASRLPSFEVNDRVVSVSCEGEPGSGSTTGGGGPPTSPTHAILTLGDDPDEDGIARDGDAGVNVDGAVFSHSTIRSLDGALTVNGRVDAVGECTGIVLSAMPPLHCSNTSGGSGSPEANPDPGYLAAIQGTPRSRSVPGCPPAGGLVSLRSGWYRDADALNALTNGACRDVTIHLRPDDDAVGAFYFRFTGPGDQVWRIDDPTVDVIGGTATDWLLGQPLVVPGGCATQAPRHGVQLLFGADSRMHVERGRFEVCAEPLDTGQRIALFGVPPGIGLDVQIGCAVAEPYPTTGCPMFSTAPGATVVVHGTVYAPTAPIHLRYGLAFQSIDRGIIARAVRLESTVGASLPGTPIGTPAVTGRAPRVIRLVASIDGVPRLRAQVTIDDAGGLVPGRDVAVDGWTFLP